MGHFRYTMSPIAGIVDRMGIMARGKLLYESLLFLFYLEAWAYICRSFLSLTAAFKLNTLYFTIIFIEFEYIL